MSKIELLKGDCLDKLKELQDNSIDSVVTDPPYEIGFMGKGWDDSGIANNPELWKEVLRVLKPGGHLLSFSHSRTYHRQAVAVEDAGFEIRDQIMWIYGSGFPKSHNIGKSVDKLQGNEREVVGETKAGKTALGQNSGWNSHENRTEIEITKGNSPYEGWGTALKPAHEPIVMARKPLSEKTIVKNVLEHGTGGINIDGCRVDNSDMKVPDNANEIQTDKPKHHSGAMTGTIGKMQVHNSQGRFPANIIFDVEAGKILDEQSGITKGEIHNKPASGIFGNNANGGSRTNSIKDTGGASRFFYCPKANKKDRNEGCNELNEKQRPGQTDKGNYSSSVYCKDCGKTHNGTNDHSNCSDEVEYRPSTTTTKNFHPTVKPTDLMAYLVRMVTPKGGTVLDPFMGSGSTGKASVREGFNFVGIEREDEYMEIAKTRIEHEQSKNKHREFFE